MGSGACGRTMTRESSSEYRKPGIDGERRGKDRLVCQLPVFLSVLMPEESYNPFSTAVFLNNVSDKGVRVCCPAPPDHWPRKLRAGQRARLVIHDGRTRFHLICTIAWTAPCREVENQFCYGFGLTFDPEDPGTPEGVERLISRSQRTPASLQRHTCPICA